MYVMTFFLAFFYMARRSRSHVHEEVVSFSQDSSQVTLTVGDTMTLNYTLKTRFDCLVECFKDSGQTTSYYVLAVETPATLTRSIVVQNIRQIHSGIYACIARIPETSITTRISWTVDVLRRPVVCSQEESCWEGRDESCYRDTCVCHAEGAVFFSKMGLRTCRRPGILTFAAEIDTIPKSARDFLVVSYYLVTFGDTLVSWSGDSESKHTVAKIFGRNQRNIVEGKFWISPERLEHITSVTVASTVSGTLISKNIDLELPAPVTKVGDNCTTDVDCYNSNGFCVKDRCSCVDRSGKAFGIPYYSECAMKCKNNLDCKGDANSFCYGTLCQCRAGYKPFNQSCVKDECSIDTDCPINQVCVFGKCICAPGATFENGSCAIAQCFSDRDCFWKDTACELGQCVCQLGYKVINGKCTRPKFDYCDREKGESCRLPYSECDGESCVCKYGYHYKAVGGVESCAPVECSRSHPCRQLNTTCRDYTCVCRNSNSTVQGACAHAVNSWELQLSKLQPDPYATALYLCVGLGVFGLTVFLPVMLLKKLKFVEGGRTSDCGDEDALRQGEVGESGVKASWLIEETELSE